MDKNNKNRTDLLAAGRKRLQQFRQKKDGKSSKPSSKAGKAEHDGDADVASTAAKPAAVLQQVPEGEIGAVHDSDGQIADSSVKNSMDPPLASDTVIAISDPLSVSTLPETGTSTTSLPSSVDLSHEDSWVDEAAKKLSSGKEHDVGSSVKSTCNANIDVTKLSLGESEREVPIAVEAGIELGADQVSDEADCLDSKEVDNSEIELEGHARLDLPGLGESEETPAEMVSGEMAVKEPTIELDQTNELNNVSASAGGTDEVKGGQMDEHSIIAQTWPDSHGSPTLNPETVVPLRENVVATSFNDFNVLEILKEQLYLTNFAKDTFLLQLDEQSDLQIGFDRQHQQLINEILKANNLVTDFRGRNEILAEELAKCKSELQVAFCAKEELEKQLHTAKAEIVETSTQADELHVALETSYRKLSSLSVELDESRPLVATLQGENDSLNGTLALAVEEKKRLAEEKESFVLENEKLLRELAECKGLLTLLQEENVNLSGRLALSIEEGKQLDQEKQNFLYENNKLSTDLAGCKGFLEALLVENVSLNGGLTFAMEERSKLGEERDHFVAENRKLSMELAESKSLITSLQQEHSKAVDGLREATLHLEQLTEENIKLSSQFGGTANQVEGSDMQGHGSEHPPAGQQTLQHPKEGHSELFAPQLSKPHDVDESPIRHPKFDAHDPVDLMGHLEEAEKIIKRLEDTIEKMHAHSLSLSTSSGKVAAPGVSRLIQAFESKTHYDDHDTEEVPPKSPVDPFVLAAEQTQYLRAVLKDLLLDAANASKLFKGERDRSDAALGELRVTYEALKEQTNYAETENIELLVLYEFIRQHLCDIEANKSELLLMYEAAKKQGIVLEAQNSELVRKLGDYQLCISQLERKLDEMRSSSDEMASSFSNQVEVLQKEVAEKTSILDKEWNSTVNQVVQAVANLETLSGSSYSSTFSTGNHNALDIGICLAVSVDAVTKMIDDLQEKLESYSKDHEAMSKSSMRMTEKFNDLRGKNELAIGLLQRIYGNLKKLVNDSFGHVEQGQCINLLDPLDLDSYDTLMEQLAVFLSERLQLESENNKLSLELTNKAKDLEELKGKGLDLDAIVKLVEDVEGAVKLGGTGIESEKLESRLQSLISLLFQKYKEFDEQISLFRDANFSKEMELSKLQGQLDHLSFLIFQHENEVHILKETLRQSAEDLVAVQFELQNKVNELEQSEQRVSSIREKLSIAVSKGKGLIVQRDNLKQSLAETSSELEKCSQELQLKDAKLREIETKLKTYSEAGERVEALESELSYIRNSATALRESFLLKDSVLQRIEEILEDLELPEHFHSRDIIEKVDWLAQSVAGNSMPIANWEQKSSVEGGSYSDTGLVPMDAWKEDLQLNSNFGDDLRTKYEELQNKYYSLAEQNEMLEQSLMERNNLVQRWEEILERINMPLQLRTMEPEDRIEWLGTALSEAHHHCNSLQQKVDNFETHHASLTADLEVSQKRASELETDLQAAIHEKEHLSGSLEILSHDYDKVSEKLVHLELENDKLQNVVNDLQEKLIEKVRYQDHIEYIEGELRRLEDLVSDVLQDSIPEEVSGSSSTECLERLLRKLVEKHMALSLQKSVPADSGGEQSAEEGDTIQDKKRDLEDSKEQDISVLRKELEEALSDLMWVKDERDRYMDKNQALIREVDTLEARRQELQDLLCQEEQKSASVKEKLNVAVRKGKSLVQQRDNLKQTLGELNNEVECLKSKNNYQETCLSDYEHKVKDLSMYRERVEVLESEDVLLRNRLAEAEYFLQEKTHALSLVLNTLDGIDTGFQFNVSDPVEKLEQIGKQFHYLREAVTSSEHDSRKSKRAAELLLAELNEVQERYDGLQEELAKASYETTQLSKEIDLAEAAKREAFSQVEKLSTVHSEERDKQLAELTMLMPNLDQLRIVFFDVSALLGNVLSQDWEYLKNLEGFMMSSLESNPGALPRSGPGSIVSINAPRKEKFLATKSLLDSRIQEHIDGNTFVEICSLLRHQLQDFTKGIGALKEELHNHSIALDEGAKHVFEIAGIFQREMMSQKQSFQSMKDDIIRLESMNKEKDTENVVMRKNISLLYEACSSSVMEIENWKAEFVGNGLTVTNLGVNSDSSVSADGGIFSGSQSLLSSEEYIGTMTERLLASVKDFTSIQVKTIEGGQKELKTTISNLQMELQEKEIQKDRICVELVSQIKEAKAATKSHLQDLQSAKVHLHDLEKRLQSVEEERYTLEQKVKDLQDGEAALRYSEDRVRSLNDVLAAKDQEIEALMQALDEEETQMEDLKNKNEELERILQQKNMDVENLEASCGKAMKKLSTTVSKFDELHHLSAGLLSEVEKLQLQLQERNEEISFLRQEVTRCSNDALVASQMSNKRNSDEICDLLTWLDTMSSAVQVHDVHLDDEKKDQVHEYKEIFQKRIELLVSELENLRAVVKSRDMLLQAERSRVEELTLKGESLENSLREKESQLIQIQGVGDSGQTGGTASEIVEVEPVINKWALPGTSITPQVRSLRKGNNDQVAIAIDMDQGSGGRLEDEDDDKAHGFKSLTTSRIVPRLMRPVTDMVDGLWVSCDRTLMRQPALRLGLIIYWAVLHSLLATFVV
ncbi:trans-Golgi network-localized SYP41-interacting protein 1 isoform X2 [Diospyros lotus]|uniref:trans-Golgi network-localized SYP41-interacting protein 1 isoform X2 n=1 Tax=Diospyros lotus TaxID=55363 RepID=UPI0022544CCD|nr:trans-Golgi network-localized SYP41-interacting protein 1 isoform X2 [Diospyros lotus]